MIALKSVLQPILTQQNLDRLPKIVNLLLIVMLASTLARVTWVVLPIPELQETIPVIVKKPVGGAAQTPINKQNLGQLHLFGTAPVAPANVPVAAAPVEVPVTRLSLKLLGVLASNTPMAKAIIADASGNENYYSVNDQVPGGALLQEIHADHVMLLRNDRLEALKLPDELDGNTNFVAPSPSPQPSSVSRSRNMGSMNTANMSTGAILKDWQQKIETDPQSLMNLVRAEPVNRNGKLVGYRVMPGKDRQLLRKFGLRTGDVVTEVNSIQLDSPLKGLDILNDLKSAGQVTLGVERNGNRETLVFQVDQ